MFEAPASIARPELQCVIVAGCPRSGTSMTMQLLASAGLYVGNDLVPSSIANRRGHFEDRRIVALHEGVLNECGTSWQYVGEVELSMTKVYEQRMREIAEGYVAQGCNWGFKDPRASLFLETWTKVVGNPRVVMLYRHYAHCCRSLYRRHARALCYWESDTDDRHLCFFSDPVLPLRIWLAYNRALLDYHHLHEADCLVVSQDAILAGWDLIAAANSRFGLRLDRGMRQSVEARLADNSAIEFDFSWIAPELRAQLDLTWAELSRVSAALAPVPAYRACTLASGDLRERLTREVTVVVERKPPVIASVAEAQGKERNSIEDATSVCAAEEKLQISQVADCDRAEMEFCHWTAHSAHNQSQLVQLAIALFRVGRVSNLDYFRDHICSLSPGDPWYHYSAYRWLWSARATDAALAECRRTLEICPTFWRARLALFYSYWELGLDEDITALERPIVHGKAADMLLRLTQVNASLERHDREEYYYYAGAAVRCCEAGILDHYERLLQQVDSDAGRYILLYYLLEHVRTLGSWWHPRLATGRGEGEVAGLQSG